MLIGKTTSFTILGAKSSKIVKVNFFVFSSVLAKQNNTVSIFVVYILKKKTTKEKIQKIAIKYFYHNRNDNMKMLVILIFILTFYLHFS